MAAVRNDVWKRAGEYENVRALGDTLIGACDVDKEIVRRQLDAVKLAWERLNNGKITHLLKLKYDLEPFHIFTFISIKQQIETNISI